MAADQAKGNGQHDPGGEQDQQGRDPDIVGINGSLSGHVDADQAETDDGQQPPDRRQADRIGIVPGHNGPSKDRIGFIEAHDDAV